MKKTLKQIGCTALGLGVICAVFWLLHWITSPWQVVLLYAITAAVIACDLLCRALFKWVRGRFCKRK